VGGRAPLTPDPESVALVTLLALPGVGNRVARRLLASADSREEVLDGIRTGVLAAPRGARGTLLLGEVEAEARATVRLARKEGVRILGIDEPAYPPSLLRLHDPPAVLYLRGNADLLLRTSVAIVGARRATPVGRRVAEGMARELARAGLGVVSGLATGIDAAAHRGAVGEAGGTVAVLGRGPDRAYPLANAGLFHQIAADGLLVSEFPPGIPARSHHFPRRNRVLAALAEGVVLVEAGARSGAFHTVNHALDLGLEVMAVPGSAESPASVGTNALLVEGVPPVLTAGDVIGVLSDDEGRPDRLADRVRQRLQALAAGLPPGAGGRAGGGGGAAGTGTLFPEEDPEVAFLLRHLGPGARPVEDLLEETGLPPSKALALLSRLELQGRVRREPDGWIATGAGLEANSGAATG
jgi:DNA processing protein